MYVLCVPCKLAVPHLACVSTSSPTVLENLSYFRFKSGFAITRSVWLASSSILGRNVAQVIHLYGLVLRLDSVRRNFLVILECPGHDIRDDGEFWLISAAYKEFEAFWCRDNVHWWDTFCIFRSHTDYCKRWDWDIDTPALQIYFCSQMVVFLSLKFEPLRRWPSSMVDAVTFMCWVGKHFFQNKAIWSTQNRTPLMLAPHDELGCIEKKASHGAYLQGSVVTAQYRLWKDQILRHF